MSFQISDKVVCVDDKFSPQASSKISNLPVKGNVYVVRDCFLSKVNNQPVVFIVGSIGIPHSVDGECGFWSWRFRKLSDVKSENAAKRRKKEPQP